MTPQDEYRMLIDAVRDQENTMAAQATEFADILDELKQELDTIRHARRQYEADLHEMRPLLNAIRSGARIDISYPEPEYRTLNGYYDPPRITTPTYYTEPPGYGIHP